LDSSRYDGDYNWDDHWNDEVYEINSNDDIPDWLIDGDGDENRKHDED